MYRAVFLTLKAAVGHYMGRRRIFRPLNPFSGFSVVRVIEELFGRTSSGFGLEIRDYSRRDPSR
jgi:hypothetical protein